MNLSQRGCLIGLAFMLTLTTAYGAAVDGGTVQTDGGETEVAICVDGTPDVVTFANTSTEPTANYSYVITDTNRNVVGGPGAQDVDFDAAGVGVCYVFGISFRGTLENTNATVDDITATDCLELSSNFIVVNRQAVDGGTVETDGGATSVAICVDGNPDVITFANTSTATALEYSYVVTDAARNILGGPGAQDVDFDGAGVGDCYVFGISYTGTLENTDGTVDDITSTGCLELSSNFIMVNRQEVDGGTVETDGGATSVAICVDGNPDVITFANTSTATALEYSYVVTDAARNILGGPGAQDVDFDGAGVGDCYVFGISYTGTLENTDGTVDDITSTGCLELSSNFIMVNRQAVDGGTVETDGGATSVAICVDGNPDVITFANTSTATALEYSYVVTDAARNILGGPGAQDVDFDGAGVGDCYVFGISYTGTLENTDGTVDDITSTGCLELSSNFIMVNRQEVDGGTVETDGGATSVAICVDGNPDVITFANTSTATALEYSYVVTDAARNILGGPGAQDVDFDGAGVGDCYVFGISYTGTLENTDGTVDDITSTGCLELSSNFIMVNRQAVDGGTVETDGGATSVAICVDGNPDVITFANTSTATALEYSYVVTDAARNILGGPGAQNVDFDGAGVGDCYVFGISYTGTLENTDGTVDDITSTGCLELSSNFIMVNRQAVDGGTVETDGGATSVAICVDGNPDVITFANTSTATALEYSYVVTDAARNILGGPGAQNVDFDGAGVGDCYVFGISYTGTLENTDGTVDDITSTGCLELSSNFIVVNRQEVDGGTVETDGGATSVAICVDGNPDVITFANTSTATALEYSYVVTDAARNILGGPGAQDVDFDGAGVGDCYVFGISYTGTLENTDGTVDDITSTGCLELSSNFIVVNRQAVDGGTVETDGGATSVAICVDGNPDVITFANTSTATALEYSYVVTDAARNILGGPGAQDVDFDGAGVGDCYVFGISYTGTLENTDGTVDDITSTGCLELSSNFIVVNRQEVDGGTVETDGGATSVAICVDGNPDVVTFANTSTATALEYSYVVTDAARNILGGPGAQNVDFDGAGVGDCYVFGISYTGTLENTDGTVDDITSTGCLELSSNFIVVNRQAVDGGTVETDGGATSVAICVDGNPDVITFANTSTATALEYSYVVTDAARNILGGPGAQNVDFDGAGVGDCYVFGISYTGTLENTDGTVDDITSTGCLELSSNFIVVNRQEVDGGTVETDGGATSVAICVDGNPDVVTFANTSTATALEYSYVVTDAARNILGGPGAQNVDFDGAGVGDCYVFGISYTGTLENTDGTVDDITSTGCLELSSNFIVVNRQEVDGGTVETDGGATSVAICVDGNPDVITFANTSTATALEYSYVVTDTARNILGGPGAQNVDFDAAGAGDCYVFGISYTGTLENTDATVDDITSTGCLELSSNFIVVNRTGIDGGTVETDTGATSVGICVDGNPDVITFANTSTATGAAYSYVVTDTARNILGGPGAQDVDFDGAGVGVCYVFGISYTGTLENTDGTVDDITSTGCLELSSNFIVVNRQEVDGGTVETDGGDTTVLVCVDGNPDVITFANTSTATALEYSYVVTDTARNILGGPGAQNVDFDGAGVGDCYVFGISYTGTLENTDGTVDDITSTGCFELSSNFIMVNRQAVDGGTVETSTGATTVGICVDGNADVITFANTSTATGAEYSYVVTDAERNILGGPGAQNVDFDAAGVGDCYVFGISYTGTLENTDGTVDDITSTGCLELSSNFIVVNRQEVDGGTVETDGGDTTVAICVDGNPDVITFANTSTATALEYSYVVTDASRNILGGPGAQNVDFDGAGVGDCYVFGISYTGTLENTDGTVDDITSTGCFELSSNFIMVNRQEVDGGTVETDGGLTEVVICVDGNPDVVTFANTSTATHLEYSYVVTDDARNILGGPGAQNVDFDGAGVGECYVFGISYTGTLENTDGTVDDITSTGCLELSSNFIQVFRQEADGATVETDTGETTVTICVDDIADVISFANTSTATRLEYSYVVTDTNNNILGGPGAQDVDFNGAGVGECWVYGISFTGTLADTDGTLAGITSTGCMDVSDNFIIVFREEVDGGTVQTDGGDTAVAICVDGNPDIITFANTSTATHLEYSYVVTDTARNILGGPGAQDVNFDGAGVGECWVFGISFSGALENVDGTVDDITSTGCMELSDNFITVIRQEVDGGTVHTTAGLTEIEICVDATPDVITFSNSSAATALNYSYVVTDTSRNILAGPGAQDVDFNGAGVGECWVFGISYTGTLGNTGGAVDDITSTGCLELSDNFLVVNRIDCVEIPWYPRVGFADIAAQLDSPFGWYNLQVFSAVSRASTGSPLFQTNVNAVELAPKDYFVRGFVGFQPGEYTLYVAPFDPATARVDSAAEMSTNFTVAYGNSSIDFPAGFGNSIADAGDGNFDLTFTAMNAQGFELRMTAQSDGSMRTVRQLFTPDAGGNFPLDQENTVRIRLTEADQFTLEVRGLNPFDQATSNFTPFPDSPINLGAAPAVVNLAAAANLHPANRALITLFDEADTATITLSWDPVAGATSYLLFLRESSRTPMMNFESVGNITSIDLELGIGDYSWIVVPRLDGDEPKLGPWSEYREFGITLGITEPIILGVQQIDGATVLIGWAVGSNPATVEVRRYHAADNAGQWSEVMTLPVVRNGNANSGQVTFAIPFSSGRNYLYIRGADAEGNAGPAKLIFFDTP